MDSNNKNGIRNEKTIIAEKGQFYRLFSYMYLVGIAVFILIPLRHVDEQIFTFRSTKTH